MIKKNKNFKTVIQLQHYQNIMNAILYEIRLSQNDIRQY